MSQDSRRRSEKNLPVSSVRVINREYIERGATACNCIQLFTVIISNNSYNRYCGINRFRVNTEMFLEKENVRLCACARVFRINAHMLIFYYYLQLFVFFPRWRRLRVGQLGGREQQQVTMVWGFQAQSPSLSPVPFVTVLSLSLFSQLLLPPNYLCHSHFQRTRALASLRKKTL